MQFNNQNSKKNTIIKKIVYNVMLVSMLHSSFVAPAQEMAYVYFTKQEGLYYKGYRLLQEENFQDTPYREETAMNDPQEKQYNIPSTEVFSGIKENTVLSDVHHGFIGITKENPLDDPKDNLFKFFIEDLPAKQSKVYLTYELYGLQDHHSVSRSINDRFSTGGHIIKSNSEWTLQKEEIDIDWLKKGENRIMFGIPYGANFQYQVRNLKIEFEKKDGNVFLPILVTASPTINFIKDNKLYIKGFLRNITSKEVTVFIENAKLPLNDGEFEGFLELTPELKQRKFAILKAVDINGVLGQEIIHFDNMVEADKSFPLENYPEKAIQFIEAEKGGIVKIEGASINIKDSTLTKNQEISITRLRRADVAPMASGMINVTKGGSAFRFLPDGTLFNKMNSIAIEYDEKLIPNGYSSKDIKTFYFNTNTKSWIPIPRDTVNEKEKTVISLTNHFTDYVNGIIQTPESPETAGFTPTMMSDIKAADPSAEMTLISPPEVSQKGEANISYPIKIPAGRNGMQPQIDLQYNSDGGSGWLGQGWSINIPAITIDTRWGVPVLNPNYETEIYTLGGEQLMYPKIINNDGNAVDWMPNRHYDFSEETISTASRPRLTNAVFTPRKQGSFAKIERKGTNPSNYYWKVINTDGTISWYGGKTEIVNNTVIKNEQGNIVHWGLYMTEDIHGNNIFYQYYNPENGLGSISSPNSNLSGGKIFLIDKIHYTGSNGVNNGPYEILFKRLLSYRQDSSIDARLGVKMVDCYFLSNIIIKRKENSESNFIRKYDFSTDYGKLKKGRLNFVRELDKTGTEFYRHTFSYYNDIPDSETDAFFSIGVDITICNDDYVESQDTDGDGVFDENDNCPELPGNPANHGCPDPPDLTCKIVTFPLPLNNIVYKYFFLKKFKNHNNIYTDNCQFRPWRLKFVQVDNNAPLFPNVDQYLTHYENGSVTNLCPINNPSSGYTLIRNTGFELSVKNWLSPLLSNYGITNLEVQNLSQLLRVSNFDQEIVDYLTYGGAIFSFLSSNNNLSFDFDLEYSWDEYNGINDYFEVGNQTDYEYGKIIHSGTAVPSLIRVNNVLLSSQPYNLETNLNNFITDFKELYGEQTIIEIENYLVTIRVVNPVVDLESIKIGTIDYPFSSCKWQYAERAAESIINDMEVLEKQNNQYHLFNSKKESDIYSSYNYNNYNYAFQGAVPITTDPDCISFLNYDFLIQGYTPSFDSSLSILGSSTTKAKSEGFYLGFGVGCNFLTKSTTVGIQSNWSKDTSNANVASVDINGDGLEDIVINEQGFLSYKAHLVERTYNENNEEEITHSFGPKRPIMGIDNFYKANSSSKSRNTQVTFGVSSVGGFFGIDKASSDSTTSIYFTDGNGDGLIDIVKNGVVYFNKLDVNGNPNFITESETTENMLIVAEPVTVEEPIEDELEIPDYDVVKVWEAPADGEIKIINNISIAQDETKEAIVTIEKNIDSFIMNPCPDTYSNMGNYGEFNLLVDFGTSTGNFGIEYDAFSVPDKFTLNWNNQSATSNYVGHSGENQALLNAGVSPSEIFTADPTNGHGFLYFNKNTPYPTTANVTVIAPLIGTAWEIKSFCDNGPNERRIIKSYSVEDFNSKEFRSCYKVNIDKSKLFHKSIYNSEEILFKIKINGNYIDKENYYRLNFNDKYENNIGTIKNLSDLLNDIKRIYSNASLEVNEDFISITINNSFIFLDNIVLELLDDTVILNSKFIQEDCNNIANNAENLTSDEINTHEVFSINTADCNYVSRDMCLLFGATLNQNLRVINNVLTNLSTSCNPIKNSIYVKKGDRIYFRVQSKDGGNPRVNWNPKIEYTDIYMSNVKDENDLDIYKSSYSDGFILSGKHPLVAPSNNGTATITWPTLTVNNPSDQIVYQIYKKVLIGNEITDDIDFTNSDIIYEKICNSSASTSVTPVNLSGISFSNPNNPLATTLFYFKAYSNSNIDWKNNLWKPKVTFNYQTAVIGENGIQESTVQSTETIYPIVDFSIYKSYPCSPPYTILDLYQINNGNGINPKIQIGGSGGYFNSLLADYDNVKLWFVVKSNGKTITKKYITKNGNNIIILPNNNAELINFPTDSQLEISFYSDDSQLLDDQSSVLSKLALATNSYVKILYDNSPSTYNIPPNKINLFQKVNPKFGPMYRQWGQFMYNPDAVQGAISSTYGYLIKEDVLVYDQNQADAIQSVINNLESIGENGMNETILDNIVINNNNLFNTPLLIATPTKISYDQNTYYDRWTGTHTENYSTSNGFRAASLDQMADDEYDVEAYAYQNVLETGAFAINKISRGKSKNQSGGFSVDVGVSIGVNASKTIGANNKTLTDYIDFNGDKYPDIVTQNKIQYTNGTGGLTVEKPRSGVIYEAVNSTVGFGAQGSYSKGGDKGNSSNGTGCEKPRFVGFKGNSGGGISGSFSQGEGITTSLYTDINGDGLSDLVQKDANGIIKIKLNYGYSSEVTSYSWNLSDLFVSKSQNISGGLGISKWNGSFEAGASLTSAWNSTEATLIDINGDGLLDLVKSGDKIEVALNRGNNFVDFGQQWSSRNLKRESVSIGATVNLTGTVAMVWPLLFFCLKLPALSGSKSLESTSTSKTKKSITDYDGDGYPDIVEQINNNTIRVHSSNIRRTDKLKTVTNSLNGSFTIDYKPQKTDYNSPHPKWVMSEVLISDGYNKMNDGKDVYRKEFVYENGKYDRRERQFYGYETIKSIDYLYNDQDEKTGIYRTKIDKYHNKSYFLNGLLKESMVILGNNPDSLFSKTENFYEIRKLNETNTKILPNTFPNSFDVGGKEGRRSAAVVLTKTRNYLYELAASPGLISEMNFYYDDYGNINLYQNLGNSNDSSDNYTSTITYHTSPALVSKNILRVPKEIIVGTNGDPTLRKRTTTVNEATGEITSVNTYYSSTEFATTTMEYDNYGNLKKITYPDGGSGSMFYKYTYDTEFNKYIEKTENAFGYISTAVYNSDFDKIRETVDIAGNKAEYTYDSSGRTLTVRGPKEIEDHKPYTIKFDYYLKRSALPSGHGIATDDDFVPVAVTSHYDQQYPGNDIETYTFIDGLARPIQIKKDIQINVEKPQTPNYKEALSVSGMVTYDEFGRAIKQYHPNYELKANNTRFKLNEELTPFFTSTDYDPIDRVIETIDPDNNSSIIQYSVDTDNFGTTAVKTKTIVDQNSTQQLITEVYKDVHGKVISTMNEGPDGAIWTRFTYSSIGELLRYTDNEQISTNYKYDMLGRKILVDHPDNGITTFDYDAAGNLTRLQTANLANDNTLDPENRFIKYRYSLNRLTDITYPDTPSGENISNVSYKYGSSGNDTGRVIWQKDATGEQEFAYGNMGEIVHNKRFVVGPNIPNRIFETSFEYDSWNRLKGMRYPDGERVHYSYDLGGNLFNIRNGEGYEYIKRIDYDHYEQRTYLLYGNNTETFYSYTPDLRRLDNLTVKTSDQQDLYNNRYSYDKVGNVTDIYNNAGYTASNNMGGIYDHRFTYDNLNRLVGASGSFKGNPIQGTYGNDFESGYDLRMTYNSTHGITTKVQNHIKNNAAFPANTYENNYKYIEGTHKVGVITANNSSDENFRYDYNGNIQRRERNGAVSEYHWDESNRLRVVYANYNMQHYIYDASGERVLKAGSDYEAVYENGSLVNPPAINIDSYTTYPSAFLVIDPNGIYSKHYYAGTQRIVSRLGEQNGDIFNLQQRGVSTTEDTGSQAFNDKKLQQAQIADLQQYLDQAKLGKASFKEYKATTYREEEQLLAEDEEGEKPVQRAPEVPPIYYYHPDHLGTSTFLTDANGNAYQFFLNLPFGETMAEQYPDSYYKTPYKFNGKELDEETGLYYYGARYYDPRISIWLSVDPLFEEFPNWNPYNYTMQNPINLIDPTGMSAEGPGDGNKEPASWASRAWTEVKSWFGGKKTTVNVDPLEEGGLETPESNTFVKFLADFTGGSEATRINSEAKEYSTRSDGSTNWAGYAAYTLMQEKISNPGGLEIGRNLFGRTSFVAKGVSAPKGWITKASGKGGGVKFVDPKNPHNQIRQMPGNPNSSFPAQQNPYIKYMKDGKFYDVKGNPLPSGNIPEAHIPLNQFNINNMPKF